ncbi:MAG: type II secretion system F family protein [Candidatus Taylorbacteria bacterium]|nr:type II secretion system F family protein [Candidatus Taylorbacteria bacterium]
MENLSLLIASGMGISSALSSISMSIKGRKLKRVTKAIEEMVNEGIPLWQAFEVTKLLSDRVISLIRSGEEAGRLAEHLNLVTIQQHKEKVFNSRLKSALLYPGIVLILAFIVAIASSWIILPKLVSIFQSANGTLPFTTRTLLWIGEFLSVYGAVVVPAVIAGVLAIVYFVFFFKKTKFIGDYILFSIPGIRDLIQGVELARFGYIFGVLLQAGFQVNEALESVKNGTTYSMYRKFYNHLQECIANGDTFKTALSTYKKPERFLPIPIQQLILSAEKSGRLSETFIKTGVIFEEKTDAMSRDLSTVLEPIILIVVGIIVGFVVLAVIGPIYGLSEQI